MIDLPKNLKMDNLQDMLDGPRNFINDSSNLLKRCKKPDQKGLNIANASIEFYQIARAVGMGFVVMGFIGFFVKLIHIPINNIIVVSGPIIILGNCLRLDGSI